MHGQLPTITCEHNVYSALSSRLRHGKNQISPHQLQPSRWGEGSNPSRSALFYTPNRTFFLSMKKGTLSASATGGPRIKPRASKPPMESIFIPLSMPHVHTIKAQVKLGPFEHWCFTTSPQNVKLQRCAACIVWCSAHRHAYALRSEVLRGPACFIQHFTSENKNVGLIGIPHTCRSSNGGSIACWQMGPHYNLGITLDGTAVCVASCRKKNLFNVHPTDPPSIPIRVDDIAHVGALSAAAGRRTTPTAVAL